MKFAIIAAADKNLGIGIKGRMPWQLSTDLKYFNKITVGNGRNAVIMGRATWESLPEKHRPLKNRINIVVTRNSDYEAIGANTAESIEEALKIATELGTEKTFVIGGAQIYAQAIELPACEEIYLTEVDAVYNCDAFFPKIDAVKFKKAEEGAIQEENGIKFRFCRYVSSLSS